MIGLAISVVCTRGSYPHFRSRKLSASERLRGKAAVGLGFAHGAVAQAALEVIATEISNMGPGLMRSMVLRKAIN
jgi:hypothetical protein